MGNLWRVEHALPSGSALACWCFYLQSFVITDNESKFGLTLFVKRGIWNDERERYEIQICFQKICLYIAQQLPRFALIGDEVEPMKP